MFLVHGFRWPRGFIRAYIDQHKLKVTAPGWIAEPSTQSTLLASIRSSFPALIDHVPNLRLIEQHDATSTSRIKEQPYAYVADTVYEVSLGVDVDEVRGRGVPTATWAAAIELRDQLAPEEKVAWFVVVCQDDPRCTLPTGRQRIGNAVASRDPPRTESERVRMAREHVRLSCG